MTDKKSILITGASRGIGLQTTKKLAGDGHHVYASMRDPEGRNASASQALKAWTIDENARVTVLSLDVTDAASIKDAVARIEADGPLDCLINNAGIMPTGITEAFSIDDIQRCLDVNFLGLAKVTRAVLPGMRKRRDGLIIHVSSAAGRLALPFFGIYCASKWAMEAYAETLHHELADFGVQSIIVEPSGHATDLAESAPRPSDHDVLADYGDLAHGRERLIQMFEMQFAEGDAITDAGNVAEKIAGLIEMTGPRPIRTPVGQDMGVGAINAATAPIQAGVVAALSQVYKG